MTEINEGLIRIIETLIIAGLVSAFGYFFAFYRTNRKKDKLRDTKLDKLVEYHEGVPADDFLGRPRIMGLNERLEKQELISEELGEIQRLILQMVHTGNGRTIGQKVDNIEHIAADAAVASAKASEKAEELKAVLDNSLALQEAHLADGKKIMEIGVKNDEAEWEALRQHGIEMPEYQYPPEDVIFSLDDLKKRNETEK